MIKENGLNIHNLKTGIALNFLISYLTRKQDTNSKVRKAGEEYISKNMTLAISNYSNDILRLSC